MPGGSVIGALRVNLGIDTAQFSEGLKDAQAKLGTFAKGLALLGGGFLVGEAIGKAIRGIGDAVKGAIDQADEMGKAAQKFGLPVEELSKLKYAADLSDVSLQTLGASLGILSKNMVSAAEGGNKAQAAFGAIGVSVKDANGQLRPTSDVLADIATKFAGTQDGAAKTALAMALMGKGGKEMIPLLDSGGASIKAMGEEAQRLGVVITNDTAQAAQQFNDDLTRLETASSGLAMRLASVLVPALADVADAIIVFLNNLENIPAIAAEAFGRVLEIGDGLRLGLNAIASNIPAAFIAAFQSVVHAAATAFTAVPGSIGEKIIQPLKDADAALAGMSTGGMEEFRNGMANATELITGALRPLESVIHPIQTATSSLGELGTSFARTGGAASKAKKDGFEKAADGIVKQTEALKARTAAQAGLNPLLTDYGSAEAFATAQANLLTAAQQAGIPVTDALRQRVAGLAQGYADATAASGVQEESMGRLADAVHNVDDVGADVTSGLVQGLLDGASASEVLSDALGRVADALLQSGINALFQPQAGGVSVFNSVLSAMGIPGFANGVRSFAGGLARVNERGGELINLPRGAQVVPHDLSQKAMGGSYTFAPVYNMPGADAAQVAQLRQENLAAWSQFEQGFRGNVQRSVRDRRNLGKI